MTVRPDYAAVNPNDFDVAISVIDETGTIVIVARSEHVAAVSASLPSFSISPGHWLDDARPAGSQRS
jgi:hypothetical protein